MDERSDNTGQQPAYTTGAPPQPAYYPQQPPKKKRTTPLWATILIGVGAFAIGIAAGSGAKPKQDATPAPAATAGQPQQAAATTPAPPPAPADKGAVGDVTLNKFTIDSIGSVSVPVTVVNHSSKTSNYLIEFEVDNAAGTKIGDGIASTNNLAPGQKAEISGIAMATGDSPTLVKLTKVTRYAS